MSPAFYGYYQVVGNSQRPPFDQRKTPRQPFWIFYLQSSRVVSPLQAERRISVSAQSTIGIVSHSPVPAEHPHVEVENPPGIPAGKQNGKKGHNGHDEKGNPHSTTIMLPQQGFKEAIPKFVI
jgi:hypothetical protein